MHMHMYAYIRHVHARAYVCIHACRLKMHAHMCAYIPNICVHTDLTLKFIRPYMCAKNYHPKPLPGELDAYVETKLICVHTYLTYVCIHILTLKL